MKKLISAIPLIRGERLELRPLTLRDAPCLKELTESEEVYRYLPTFLFEQKDNDPEEDIRRMYSDRGSNYCSKTFCDYLRTLNITQSFSKPHTPHDNAVMESFFSNMKREALYRTAYRSEREFRKAVEQYIIFYNEERPHHHNSYKTPAKCESMYFQKLGTARE